MLHGLSFLPDSDSVHGIGLEPSDYFSMVGELCRMADEANLSYIKMTEHYGHAYGGYCPSPLMFLASIANSTERIRLMTGALLPTFHHPVQIASDAALLDVLSNGRLDLGVARAYMPYEFDAFEIPLDSSRSRFDETVSLVQRLWKDLSVSAEGPNFHFENVRCLPQPIQQPGPPIWVAAVMTPGSFIAAGKNGHGLLITPSLSRFTEIAELVTLYRENFRPSESFPDPVVLASLPIYVGSDPESAEQIADPLLEQYLTVWASAADAWSRRTSADYRGYTGMSRAIRSMTASRMRENGGAIVGGPSEVSDRICATANALEVDGFLWQVDFGGTRVEDAMPSVRRLIEEVIPRTSRHR